MSEESLKYIPFARKYRSTNFSELMGQEVLVKTLSYCIANNRLASAYLLTGIRGVGKTSSARIIAKTVNCTDLSSHGEQIAPCEKCKNCISCTKQNHPDIIEIDAASRTGVDDIREIIESSEYKPLLGAYKFFIIDEIHNILAGSTHKQREFLNILRFLGNELQLPIVGVGIKDAYLAIRSDDQLENR